MRIFPPGPVAIGRVADAILAEVSSGPLGAVARYGLAPLDESEYVERTTFVRPYFGLRYAPLPGLWVAVRPTDRSLDSVEPQSGVELLVGAESSWLRTQTEAGQVLGLARPSIVSPLAIRVLGLGLLHRVGIGG